MELYEKCCEMLIDARDCQRNIDDNIYINLPKLDYSKKRIILERIAYWMLDAGVVQEEKSIVCGFLEHIIKDANIITNKGTLCDPKLLLDYFVERSGIIRELEEGYIEFIHKTFMEYLAAKNVCRECSWSKVVAEACNINWKETIIMVFRQIGKSVVNNIIRKLIEKGKSEGDDRYILMAALGASNAIFTAEDELKKQIDKKIKSMIPPNQNNIYEMVSIGIYIIPFLKDSDIYSTEEKIRCLSLLHKIGEEEGIVPAITYIKNDNRHIVKILAIDMLSSYNEQILYEYNVKEKLKRIMMNNMNNDRLTVYENMMYMLYNEKLNNNEMNMIQSLSELKIICSRAYCNSLYEKKSDFFKNFRQCSKLALIGKIETLNFLTEFDEIDELKIVIEDASKFVQELHKYKALTKVKKVIIEAKKMAYFCERDINQMKNLEHLEINCSDMELELNLEGFKEFLKLTSVVITGDGFVIEKLNDMIPQWKKMNPKCEYTCIEKVN